VIHLIIATNAEARPLIDYYKLKKKSEFNEFQIYSNNKKELSITICGIGKVSAAISVTHTYYEFGCQKNQIWINFGLAGHKNINLGELVLVNKVIDTTNNYKFYPFFAEKINLLRVNCKTYDSPNYNYTENLTDMECSGFFFSANKYSTKELIHSIKIISDNKLGKINFKNKLEINQIIEKKIEVINTFMIKIEALRKKFFSIDLKIDEESKKIFSEVKFTFTQKQQLKKLLQIYFTKFTNLRYDNINLKMPAGLIISKLRHMLDHEL